MPSFGPILEGIAKATEGIGRALTTPSIPEAAERAAAEATVSPAGPLAERHVGVPFQGPEQMRPALRSVGPPAKPMPETVEDIARQMRTTVTAPWQSDPGLPKDLRAQFIDARHVHNKAQSLAAAAMEHYHAPLKGPQDAALMWDYAVAADDLAQAQRTGYDTIRKLDDKGKVIDIPVEDWARGTERLNQVVKASPDVVEALARRRQTWNDVFQDMTNEGAIVPDRYLQDYTPLRHLNGVAQNLARVTGDEALVNELSAVKHRDKGFGPRQTNLAAVEHKVLTQYFQWKADKDFFGKLISDQTLNYTGRANAGDKVTVNGKSMRLAAYHPGPGAVGYMPQQEGDEQIAGMLREMKAPIGGYVLPQPLVTALERFNAPRMGKIENAIANQTKRLARVLNTYNPKVLAVNLFADPVTALLGLPGEPARPLGLLKYYGTGLKSGLKYARTGNAGHVRIGDQIVDLTSLLESEDVSSGTYMAQVKGEGQNIPRALGRFFPKDELQGGGPLGAMQDIRQGVELAPRIAMGLDALERTGNIKEFGRVARAITLEYGAGAPLTMRVPILRTLGPFMSYPGLAFERIMNLVKEPSSRARSIAAIAAVPLGVYAWNNQNEFYKKVQDAIPSWERGTLPIIMPNPTDPSQPMLDIEGKPVVLRFRYGITEDAARLVGLHNLLPRLDRIRTGQETPASFAEESASQIGQGLGSMLTMPGLAMDMLSDTDRFGRHRSLGEKLQRVLPQVRIANEAWNATRDHGVAQGAKRLAEETAGLSFSSVQRKGATLLDSRLMDRIHEFREAKGAYISAKVNKGPSDVANAKDRLTQGIAELKRYVAWRRDHKIVLNQEEKQALKDAQEGGQ